MEGRRQSGIMTTKTKVQSSSSSVVDVEKVLGSEIVTDSDSDSDKEKKCLRLLKNKSDDIERYDHVQFLIREVPTTSTASGGQMCSTTATAASASEPEDTAAKEPPDDCDFICESKSSRNN